MRDKMWLFSIVIAAALAASQDANAGTLRLTVEEAVARASTANVDLSASRKDVDVAQATLTRSRALLPANPYLSAGSQHTSQGVRPNYSFLLSQEFEIGGQRRKRIDAAAQGVEKATLDVKNAEQTLAATVKTVFLYALIGIDRVTLAHQGVDAASQLNSQLPQERQGTDTQRFDFNIAKIQESRARRDLAAAERTRDAALGSLRRLLGIPMGQEIELVGAPQTEPKPLPPDPELIERALRQRQDLAALRQAVRRSEALLTLTKREAIPNVTLSGTVARFEGDTLVGGDVGIPLPLFNRKAGDAQEVVAERERAALEVQGLEQTIRQEVIDARRTCADAATDLQTFQRDIIPKNEENLGIERRLTAQGDATIADLIGVQIDVLSARGEYLDALQTYNESLLELERVIGGSLNAR